MKVIVVDGQGGGVGRMLVQRMKERLPDQAVIAVGTNALATSAMIRAGAAAGATGENAVCYNCENADLILGPSGIAIPNAMLGEISPAMALAVSESRAEKLLLPMDRCGPQGLDRRVLTIDLMIDEAVGWLQNQTNRPSAFR